MNAYLNFNSNLVRLKVGKPPTKKNIPKSFQFQFGAIKRRIFFCFSSRFLIFQFQFGAIKRLLTCCLLDILIWFQFQFGAIKSKHRCSLLSFYCSFQFQFGAIKRFRFLCKLLRLSLFQFQFGAIKRDGKAEMERIRTNFNSNLVRLKAFSSNSLYRFNSISIPIWCD